MKNTHTVNILLLSITILLPWYATIERKSAMDGKEELGNCQTSHKSKTS